MTNDLELGPRGRINDSGQALDAFEEPDLSAAEYAEHYAGAVANGIEATRLAKVIDMKHAPGQIHLMCRVGGRTKEEAARNEREFVHGPIKHMLFRLSGVAETFFGKEFFLKDPEKDKYRPAASQPIPENLTPDGLASFCAESMNGTGLAEVVKLRAAPDQLHLMCRVQGDKERDFVHGPLRAMLLMARRGVAETFFGKEFFLKDNQMVYAWSLSIGSGDLARAAASMRSALQDYKSIVQLEGPPIIYTWVISLGCEDLKIAVSSVSEALAEASPRMIVVEAPLSGPGTPPGGLARGVGTKGPRGAAPIRG